MLSFSKVSLLCFNTLLEEGSHVFGFICIEYLVNELSPNLLAVRLLV